MSNERTIADVIEEHRLLVGADEVRLPLGPEATAENLEAELARLREASHVYNSFTGLEQAEAKIARFREKFRRIRKLTQRETITSIEDLDGKLRNIFLEADWLIDVDQEADTAWIVKQREKKARTE
ncbi:hypothetical protein LCGC14_0111360 [marine sediment metagenome]|uniref:Uncharacterized protein n=2 Tax=root TaxID=1 RepID=A0A7V1BEW1_9RHOB|nr:hypothetical protein [Sulfitobacter litoralis]HDZ51560.1 hypothetical protein [Sulfitobacter litoralis]